MAGDKNWDRFWFLVCVSEFSCVEFHSHQNGWKTIQLPFGVLDIGGELVNCEFLATGKAGFKCNLNDPTPLRDRKLIESHY